MTPKSFTEVVQAAALFLILAAFLYQTIINPDLKDALINVVVMAVSFWLGSSRSSQQKDENNETRT